MSTGRRPPRSGGGEEPRRRRPRTEGSERAYDDARYEDVRYEDTRYEDTRYETPPARPQRERPAAERERRPRERPQREAPPKQRSDLVGRVIVAVPAAFVAIVLIDIGGPAWMVFMAIMGCLCLNELYRMLSRWNTVPWVGYASCVGMCIAAQYGGLRDVMEVAMGTVPVLFVAVAARGSIKDSTVSIAGTLLGVIWIGLAFAHAVLLRDLRHGNGIMLDVALGTFLGDTGAYFGGRIFGSRPLAPEISPKKTVEGLFCGAVVAIVAIYIASINQTYMTSGETFALGIAIALLGPMGDLFESMIKRDSGIKDAGNVFGAHGGALDRLDGVIFTVVATYYVWATLLH